MYQFQVKGMTCESCATTILFALRTPQPNVKDQADMCWTIQAERKQEPASLDNLIEKASYTVVFPTSM